MTVFASFGPLHVGPSSMSTPSIVPPTLGYAWSPPIGSLSRNSWPFARWCHRTESQKPDAPNPVSGSPIWPEPDFWPLVSAPSRPSNPNPTRNVRSRQVVQKERGYGKVLEGFKTKMEADSVTTKLTCFSPSIATYGFAQKQQFARNVAME